MGILINLIIVTITMYMYVSITFHTFNTYHFSCQLYLSKVGKKTQQKFNYTFTWKPFEYVTLYSYYMSSQPSVSSAGFSSIMSGKS